MPLADALSILLDGGDIQVGDDWSMNVAGSELHITRLRAAVENARAGAAGSRTGLDPETLDGSSAGLEGGSLRALDKRPGLPD